LDELKNTIWALERENKQMNVVENCIYNVKKEYDEKRGMPKAVCVLSDRFQKINCGIQFSGWSRGMSLHLLKSTRTFW
jgi:hypothetical protein